MLSVIFIASTLVSIISAEVIHLTADNFDSIVDGSRNVFLKFEASWCGPCKRLAPIMEEASKAFPDIDGETILASVDADKYSKIGDEFEIDSFPTIKLFLKGQPVEDAIEFSGDRTAENIVNFIKHNIDLNEKLLGDKMIARTPLSQILKTSAVVGPSPSKSSSNLANFSHIMSPYLKVADGKEKKKSSEMKIKSNRSKKSSKNSSFSDMKSEEAKRIIASAGSKPVFLVFYSHNCPHCREFLPNAENLSMKRKDVIFIKIDGDKYENTSFRDSFKLEYYPSIIGFYANSKGLRWELLKGSRNEQNLNAFLDKLSKN